MSTRHPSTKRKRKTSSHNSSPHESQSMEKKQKTEKEIKIILIISGHGSCETIECKDNICTLTVKKKTRCIFNEEKSVLHDCVKATSTFHMSNYTENIKLYSYAPYGYFNWSNIEDKDKGIYYNDFSRIYNVNREIEATIKTIDDSENDYNKLMYIVSQLINDPRYIKTFKQINKDVCLELKKLKKLKKINFSQKSIVKEIYKFENIESNDSIFTKLKKPKENPEGWVSWFWNSLGYQTDLLATETSIPPNVIFSGIFVAKTNKPANFGDEGQRLLPNEKDTNYNCDFTLFSHIRKIGGDPLCNLIIKYIQHWNYYIGINPEFIDCVKRINTISYNSTKITMINNESLYHIVNIILNFRKGSESPLIEAFSDYFTTYIFDNGDYISNFKLLLNKICDLFNVELHLMSNACRSLNETMTEELYNMEDEIQRFQGLQNIHDCMYNSSTAGGKKTRKRKCRRTKKRRRVHKRYI